MTIESDALHEQWLVLMAALPMLDYSADTGVYLRVGGIIAAQANVREQTRRDHLALSGAIN